MSAYLRLHCESLEVCLMGREAALVSAERRMRGRVMDMVGEKENAAGRSLEEENLYSKHIGRWKKEVLIQLRGRTRRHKQGWSYDYS